MVSYFYSYSPTYTYIMIRVSQTLPSIPRLVLEEIVTQDLCTLPPKIGLCSGASSETHYQKRWYYDWERETCFAFTYSGCDGNGNNFVSYDQCRMHCEGGGSGSDELDQDCKFGSIIIGSGSSHFINQFALLAISRSSLRFAIISMLGVSLCSLPPWLSSDRSSGDGSLLTKSFLNFQCD